MYFTEKTNHDIIVLFLRFLMKNYIDKYRVLGDYIFLDGRKVHKNEKLVDAHPISGFFYEMTYNGIVIRHPFLRYKNEPINMMGDINLSDFTVVGNRIVDSFLPYRENGNVRFIRASDIKPADDGLLEVTECNVGDIIVDPMMHHANQEMKYLGIFKSMIKLVNNYRTVEEKNKTRTQKINRAIVLYTGSYSEYTVTIPKNKKVKVKQKADSEEYYVDMILEQNQAYFSSDNVTPIALDTEEAFEYVFNHPKQLMFQPDSGILYKQLSHAIDKFESTNKELSDAILAKMPTDSTLYSYHKYGQLMYVECSNSIAVIACPL